MLFKLTVISILSLIHEGRTKQRERGLKVSLSIFSGRRDPKWTVSPKSSKYKDIVKLLNVGNNGKKYKKSPPARLGYKGFIVKRQGEKMAIFGQETTALQGMLLKTIPTGLISETEKNEIKVAIEESANKGSKSKPNSSKPRQRKKPVKRYTPAYDPAPWSQTDYAQECNNCYNYATQFITYTVAQPGARSGVPFRNCTANEVEQAALSDGLVRLEPHPGDNDPVPGDPGGRRLLVALVVDPENRNEGHQGDFHWYLLGQNRRWSHKPGATEVTNLDNDLREITDPRRASMGRYQFVSFMISDMDEVRITECDDDDSSMNTNNSGS